MAKNKEGGWKLCFMEVLSRLNAMTHDGALRVICKVRKKRPWYSRLFSQPG
jgi:hypothetical protein